MKQEITLTRFAINDNGAVEVEIDWNGNTFSALFADPAAVATQNADIIVSPEEAVRWLLFYLLATGTAAADLATQVGRKLVLDVRPAVQQTIALV